MEEDNALDLLQLFVRTFSNVVGSALAKRTREHRHTGKPPAALRAYLKYHHTDLAMPG